MKFFHSPCPTRASATALEDYIGSIRQSEKMLKQCTLKKLIAAKYDYIVRASEQLNNKVYYIHTLLKPEVRQFPAVLLPRKNALGSPAVQHAPSFLAPAVQPDNCKRTLMQMKVVVKTYSGSLRARWVSPDFTDNQYDRRDCHNGKLSKAINITLYMHRFHYPYLSHCQIFSIRFEQEKSGFTLKSDGAAPQNQARRAAPYQHTWRHM